jgi:hypothetical protein
MRKLAIMALAVAAMLVVTGSAPTMPTSGGGKASAKATKSAKAKKKLKRAKRGKRVDVRRATPAAATAAAATATPAAAAPPSSSPRAGEARAMAVVGHTDLGGRGFNADVWEHEGYAYVGQWGFTDWAQGSQDRFCPNIDSSDPSNGVLVVDARVPNAPEVVSRLEAPSGTSAEDVVVFTAGNHAATPADLRGHDIAAAGLQVCGVSRTDQSFVWRGLMLWDVTNPASPVRLGFVNTGCCTAGVHEFEIEHHANGRTYAYATVPTSEYEDEGSPTGFRDRGSPRAPEGRGDFRMIDVTNPRQPVEVSDWGVIHDAGGPLGPGQGCDPDPVYGHGAEPSEDGTKVFLAYWDSGFVELDVGDPTRPTYLTDSDYEGNEDGDAHSSMWDDDRGLLFSADEDFCKTSGPDIEKSWGYGRVWKNWGAGMKPVQVSTYRTPNSMEVSSGAGDYTIHNPWLVGTDVYASWYSDGVQVFDASNPDPDTTTSEESLPRVAFWVPPAAQNPVKPSQRGVLSQMPQVWGVIVRESAHGEAGRCVTGQDAPRCLVYASDMNSGLWILRRTD